MPSGNLWPALSGIIIIASNVQQDLSVSIFNASDFTCDVQSASRRKGSESGDCEAEAVPETLIDHERCVERRRKNAALYDKMTRIIRHVTGGKLTKNALIPVAQQIADKTKVPIDPGAKRMKDCLICWFCERASDLLTNPTEPLPGKQTEDEEGVFATFVR
jgi:hypothetical protein